MPCRSRGGGGGHRAVLGARGLGRGHGHHGSGESPGRLFHKGSRAERGTRLPSRARASEPASSQECPVLGAALCPAESPGAPSLESRCRAASHKCFHQLARLNQVPRKRSTAAPSSALGRRTGAGLGAGPGSVAGEPPAPRAGGPRARLKAARRAGAGAQASSGPSAWPAPGPPAWSAGAIYREPATEAVAPLPTSRAGKGTARQPRSGPGPGGARGTEAAASAPPATSDPGRARLRDPRGAGQGARWAPGPRSGAGLAGLSAAAAAERWKPGARGGTNYLSGTGAWISRTRKRQSAAPASAQSAQELHRGARSAGAPQVEQQKVQAPHQRPAGCSRGRPLAPSIRANAALRSRLEVPLREPGCVFGQGEGAGGAGRGRAGRRLAPRSGRGGRCPAARPPARAAGRRSPGAGWPPRPHDQPRRRPEPRRRQGSTAGRGLRNGLTAGRPSPPAAAFLSPPPPRSPGPGLRGRAAAAAAAAAENRARAGTARRARGRRTIAAAGPARPQPSPQAENLRGPVAPRTVPASAPRARASAAAAGRGPARAPAGRLPGWAGGGGGGGRADRWGRRQCAPRPRDAAASGLWRAPRRPIGSVLLGGRREGLRGDRLRPAPAAVCAPAGPPSC